MKLIFLAISTMCFQLTSFCQVDLYSKFSLEKLKIKTITTVKKDYGNSLGHNSRVMEYWEIDSNGQVHTYHKTGGFSILNFPNYVSDCDTNVRIVFRYREETVYSEKSVSFCMSFSEGYGQYKVDSISVEYWKRPGYHEISTKRISYYQGSNLVLIADFTYEDFLLRSVAIRDVNREEIVVKYEYKYTFW